MLHKNQKYGRYFFFPQKVECPLFAHGYKDTLFACRPCGVNLWSDKALAVGWAMPAIFFDAFIALRVPAGQASPARRQIPLYSLRPNASSLLGSADFPARPVQLRSESALSAAKRGRFFGPGQWQFSRGGLLPVRSSAFARVKAVRPASEIRGWGEGAGGPARPFDPPEGGTPNRLGPQDWSGQGTTGSRHGRGWLPRNRLDTFPPVVYKRVEFGSTCRSQVHAELDKYTRAVVQGNRPRQGYPRR
jgi:hypothetical protein